VSQFAASPQCSVFGTTFSAAPPLPLEVLPGSAPASPLPELAVPEPGTPPAPDPLLPVLLLPVLLLDEL
jgi:hypothetical protein